MGQVGMSSGSGGAGPDPGQLSITPVVCGQQPETMELRQGEHTGWVA